MQYEDYLNKTMLMIERVIETPQVTTTKIQTFAGVAQGIVLTEPEIQIIISALIGNSDSHKSECALFLRGKARTYVRYTTKEDFEDGARFAAHMKAEVDQYGAE